MSAINSKIIAERIADLLGYIHEANALLEGVNDFGKVTCFRDEACLIGEDAHAQIGAITRRISYLNRRIRMTREELLKAEVKAKEEQP